MDLFTPSLPTYSSLRAKGYHAKNAKVRIDTIKAFLALNDEKVRIRCENDEEGDMRDLMGDCFDPKVNSDIQESVLKREEKAFIDRVSRDGVWGYIAEHFDGKRWNETWSCWGFVGNDFEGSGYDIDAMTSLIDAVRAEEDAKKFLGFEELAGECACN